ncbi:MarR family winged helix-turn-helix transcriptional regulator [Microbacterium protaetiae]|uniref:MarR family winged helix-turn-helix transcriptional regulator n=1 Tax=Microbacterium protaetiae TaxID=2509458 RepID=UPI001A93580E|nr:MarR family transcriptional regulator [Microbacterium protaetiae]
MTASPAPAVALADMVCFNLHAAFRAVTAAYRPLLEPLGLSYPQYLVLAVLWDQGEAPVRELVDRLQSDYGTITPLVKRMEKQGLVTRTRNPRDERSVVVATTEAGQALSEHAPRIYQAITETFGFTPERAEVALDVLRSISAHALETS